MASHHAVSTVIAVATLVLSACTHPVQGQALGSVGAIPATTPHMPPASTGPFDAPSTTPGRYPTEARNKGDLDPPPNSDEACDLLSWAAFDQKVWPVRNPRRPPGPDNPRDPAVSPPTVKYIQPRLKGARMCRLDNTALALQLPSGDISDVPEPDDGVDRNQYFVVQTLLWNDLQMLDTKTTVAGKQASIAEDPDRCTLVIDRGDTRLGIVVHNTRFPGKGLEPCTLVRKAAEWALGVR